MQNFTNAPHRGGTPGVPSGSPNAALLIDFDNVTMGIRSDLTRQLKELLNSDIIRGKVAVQRAYADWRRYAQYIVPLSEASVDLIFAPAYGSSKKNATDIRLAIDALELVFTRPEIGVYILLSGDSDFSSLVLKLKEYGKYVIGVGLRESASDLLVQNCDEYFSYSTLTGLTKAGEEDTVSEVDPWELAERAVRQMAEDNDVMRSDRLKQVMLELDPNFDESKIGYSKFNKFLVEAASRNKLGVRKLENGQYEVQPYENGAGESRDDRRRGRGRRERREEPKPTRQEAAPQPIPESKPSRPRHAAEEKPKPQPSTREHRAETLEQSYELLKRAVRELIDQSGGAARDSDIKRQILEIQPGWDESELGFTKFSRFLRQAHDAEVIDLARSGEGYYEARLPRSGSPRERDTDRGDRGDRGRGRGREPRRETQATAPAETRAPTPPAEEPKRERPEERPEERETQATAPAAQPATASTGAAERQERKREEPKREEPKREEPKREEPKQKAAGATAGTGGRSGGVRGRRGRRGAADGPPPLLPGQVVGGSGGDGAPASSDAAASKAETEPEPEKAERPEPRHGSAATSTPSASATPPASDADGDAGVEAPGSREDAGAGVAAAAMDDAASEPAVPAQPAPGAGATFDADAIGLPTDAGAVVRYLSNSYQGVGQKTAEALIEAFGADAVFNGLHSHPERVKEVLGTGRRTEALLNAWQRDYRRRTTAGAAGSTSAGETAQA